jgi:hypothetical protein
MVLRHPFKIGAIIFVPHIMEDPATCTPVLSQEINEYGWKQKDLLK